MRLQQKAEQLSQQYFQEHSKKLFLGGPLEDFENAGRLQLITLIREGLFPESKILDIGCGCLRGAFWLIHFLNPGCYFGIEPNEEMFQFGKEHFVEPEIFEAKQPKFTHNFDFDSSVFQEKFDFFLARSVWTHASKPQIEVMLDHFVEDANETGVFLTSYFRANFWRRRDYQGESWVGRSHESKKGGCVNHKYSWIQKVCEARGLLVKELDKDIYNKQRWLKITKK